MEPHIWIPWVFRVMGVLAVVLLHVSAYLLWLDAKDRCNA